MTASIARFRSNGLLRQSVLLRQAALVVCLLAGGFAAARAQSVVDDFHACTLDPAWTFVDPLGDGGSVSIVGGYTNDAHLAISVPGGATHEAWNSAVTAPNVSRPLADANFTTIAKFVSVLPPNNAQQGLLIRQGASQWLRLEFYRDQAGVFHAAAVGSPTTVFYDAALATSAPAPLYMRISRTGDAWHFNWSHDGTNWQAAMPVFTFALHPDRLAIYAGNRGATPPAHTVQVDWIGPNGIDDDLARNTLVTSVVAGGGLVARGPDLANYSCGQAVTLTAVDQPGWAFAGWSGDATGMQNPLSVTMDGPHVVEASFVAVPVDTLVTAVSGGGSVALSPPGGIYNRGTVVTVAAIDGPGWAFSAFSGDLSGAANPQTVTMDGNRAVTATFAPVAQYTVTADVNPGGSGSVTLSPAGGTYNAGQQVVVRALPTSGWVFSGWSGDLAGAGNPDTLTVDADKAVVAAFTPLPLRTLTTITSGSGSIVRSPDQAQYLDGARVALTAVPDAGWQFTGWSGDLAGTTNPDSLAMNADRTVTATFTVIPPIIASDDFNRCDLGPAWTFVDPYGDGGTVQMNAAYSGDSHVALTVPGGFEHEIWAGFIGATHILQPAPDVDFTIEAKFDADLPSNFAQEGIVIKESETRWVRAEFFRDDFNRLRVAVDRGPDLLTHDVYLPLGLSAPLWMRVTRTGDTWVQSWSSDGANWHVAGTFPYHMTVTAAGLFAGNRGLTPPAHTVLVDYIRNTTGAPAGEDAGRAPLTVTLDGVGVVNRALNLASYACGQVETLTAVDQPGWVFSGWTGAASGMQNPLSLVMSGPAAVAAHFTAVPQYPLTASTASGQGSVQVYPPGGPYNQGARVAITAVPATGWTFAGWGGDLSGTANPDTLVMLGARSVTATFTELPEVFASDDFHACALDSVWTFVNPLGDASSWSLQGAYTDDARLAISVPTGVPHELWNGNITAPYMVQAVPDTDFNVEVKFDSSLNAFKAQEGVIVRQDNAQWLRFEFISYGALTHVVAALPDGVTVPVNAEIGPAAPYRLRVSRTGDTWHVQWSADGLTWSTPAGSGFTYPLAVTGVGVYAGNNTDNPAHTVLVDYFKNDFAAWPTEDAARAPLTVNVVGGGSVTVAPLSSSYACGEPVTLTPVASPGWIFAGWSGALGGSASPATLHMSGPATITAAFTALPERSVVVNVTGGGSVSLSPANGPYYPGERVIATAVDAPGWAFSGWSGDMSGAATPDTFVVAGDMTIGATFVAVPQHTLAVAVPGGNGTVTLSPAGGTYNQGRAVILAAQPASGFIFNGWTGDLTGAANPDTIVMDADKSVTAAFTQLVTYTLDVVVTGDGNVNISPPTGPYQAGTQVVLTAQPDAGWLFNGWSGDLSGTASPDSLVMSANRSVGAAFVEAPAVAEDDDFNACSLAPRWTFDDPSGGGSVTMVNSWSDSACVAISVPGGAPHEIWNGVIGATNIQQSVQNGDFVLEVRFDSLPPAGFGQQGLLVKQDAGHWVRAEVYRDDLGAPHIVAELGPAQPVYDMPLPAGLQAPFWMRLARGGSQFAQSWSSDGVTWSAAGPAFTCNLVVDAVGLFAGNRGANPPAHTVLVDYFSATSGVPAGEDAAVNRLEVLVSGAGVVTRSLGVTDYACGDIEMLTAVPDPGWGFTGWSGAATGTANPLALPMTGSRSVTATFVLVQSPNVVSVVAPPGASLSTVTSCVDSIAVRLDRIEANPIRSFSLGLKLTNLALCSGALSVREGGYLGAQGDVAFVVTQTSDSTLTIDGTLQSGPCGVSDPAGVLAWLDVSSLVSDGTGYVTVTFVQVLDCAGLPRIVEATGPGAVAIDHTPPAPATGLTAATVMSGNAAGSLAAINVGWVALPLSDVQSVEVWRKGFGAHPEYSDGGGAVPTIPVAGADPASAGWQLAGVLAANAAGLVDHPATRDYWYYHVRTVDAAGNRAVTPTLAVALDYLLADVAGGIGNAGDNVVGTDDVATFSGAYGSLDGQASYLGVCDVGPTADASPFSLPTTDNRVDFEDLMILSLSHGLNAVDGASALASSPAPAGSNALVLTSDTMPGVGSSFDVTIVMAGDGTVQALSLPLTWDSAVVTPVSIAPGALLAGQGGLSLVFMPQPGLVDVALLGLRERGISGAGALAVVRFEVVGTGQPRFGFGAVTARNRENAAVAVTINGVSDAPDLPVTPVVTVLHQNTPNPFNPRTTVSFDLARAGQVRLLVYGVDGRLARVLADGSLPAGNYAFTWDGTDEGGRRLASGVYLVRLVTPDGIRDVRMTMLK